MKTYYAAGFVPEEDGQYSVYFPDIPGIHTCGKTLEEATENASDALKSMLDAMVMDNDSIPQPSNMPAVMRAVREIRTLDELPFPDETVFQLVPAPSLDATPVRVSVSFAKAVLEEIDVKARQCGLTRSGFLTKAALGYGS